MYNLNPSHETFPLLFYSHPVFTITLSVVIQKAAAKIGRDGFIPNIF